MALKSHLRSRETRFGPIGDEEILFAPDAGASHVTQDVAKFKPFAKMEISRIVKGAAGTRPQGVEERPSALAEEVVRGRAEEAQA